MDRFARFAAAAASVLLCGGCAAPFSERLAPIMPRPAADLAPPGAGIKVLSFEEAARNLAKEKPRGEAATGKPDAADPKPAAPTPLPPPVSAAPGLTLNEVVRLCLLHDPKLRAGFEEINQAHADLWTASILPNPELFLDGQLLPLGGRFTPTRQAGPPQVDLLVTYPSDWFVFGKRAAAMYAAGLNVKVTECQFADLVRLRVLEASVAFHDVQEARGLRDLAKQDVESLERVEEVTKKAVDAGRRPELELKRVRLDRLRSEQALRDAENALVGALARLRATVGRTDADASVDAGGAFNAPPAGALPETEAAFAAAQTARPDICALREGVARFDAKAESERRKGFPSVSHQFGLTRQYQAGVTGFPDANSFVVATTFKLPFFDRNQGNIAHAASEAVQSRHALQAGLVALRAEIVQAVQDFRTSTANSRAVAEEQLKLAEQVRDGIVAAYQNGTRSLLDVLDAQRNYRDTYRLYISSRASYARAAVRYNAAIGEKATP